MLRPGVYTNRDRGLNLPFLNVQKAIGKFNRHETDGENKTGEGIYKAVTNLQHFAKVTDIVKLTMNAYQKIILRGVQITVVEGSVTKDILSCLIYKNTTER